MKIATLALFLMVIAAAVSQMTQINTSASARTLRRLRNGRMFERCFGKEHYRDVIKKDIDAFLQQCLQSDPLQFVKKFTKAEMPSTGNAEQDEISLNRITYELGNYTCLLQKLNFTDKALTLNMEVIEKYVGNLSTEKTMSQSLVEDVQDCNSFSKGAPSRLISKAIPPYRYMSEIYVRLGIFFHCFRGRLLMTCTEKDYVLTSKPHPPMWALNLARVPLLDRNQYSFEDLFGLLEDSSVWFSFSTA